MAIVALLDYRCSKMKGEFQMRPSFVLPIKKYICCQE
jgi:hypothetical protein